MYFVRRWWGEEEPDLPPAEFGKVLGELAGADDEHPDVALRHESEWTLSYMRDGTLVWENVEDGEPRHIRGVSAAKVESLWRALAAGRIDDVEKENWQDGY